MKLLTTIFAVIITMTASAQQAEISVNTKNATYTAQFTQLLKHKPFGVTIGITNQREAILTLRAQPKIENSNIVLNFQQGITWDDKQTYYYQATGLGYDFGKSILFTNLALRNNRKDLTAGLQVSLAIKL